MKYRDISGKEAAQAWINGEPMEYRWCNFEDAPENWKLMAKAKWGLEEFTSGDYLFRIPVEEPEFSFVTTREPSGRIDLALAVIPAAHDALGPEVEWVARVPEGKE